MNGWKNLSWDEIPIHFHWASSNERTRSLYDEMHVVDAGGADQRADQLQDCIEV